MVNIEGKLNQIMKMVTDGEYFTINRPRQYGKTTTLYLLENRLDKNNKYLVLSVSFEGIGDDSFHSERSFIEALLRQFKRKRRC
jgi:predicted AAA+ superfamily ATPase